LTTMGEEITPGGKKKKNKYELVNLGPRVKEQLQKTLEGRKPGTKKV